GVALGVVFLLQVFGNNGFAEERAGMKPGLRQRGRHIRGRVLVVGLGKSAGTRERGEFFGVPLVDSAEAAEFTFHAVVIAMMVSVAGNETVAADVVVGLHPLDDVHGKRKSRQPRRSGQLVGYVELG